MYYLIFTLLYLVSLLPLRLLYLLSDCCFFLLYRVFGYRKKIVLQNLTSSFPEESEDFFKKTILQFYHSFCDQWVETLKLLSMPLSKINNRIVGNWEVFEQAIKEGNGKVVVMLGHQFNWEWGHLATPLNFHGDYAGIYLPVKSKPVNRLLLYIRKRTGAMLIPASNLRNGFRDMGDKSYVLAFIADQTPANLNVADWHLFMNRPAPFLNGPEKVARLQRAAVVWVGLRKINRGRYQLHAELYCKNAKELPPGEMIKSYVTFLENELKNQPANWMWTHRRWKKTAPHNWKP